MMTDPRWRYYEKQIQKLFSGIVGAKVKRDVVVMGRSGRERRLELLVEYPLEIKFGKGFSASFHIKIGVDCKEHKRPVTIDFVGQFADQLDDIGAPIGIMVAVNGFDKGAEARAKHKNIFLVHASWDLLSLALSIRAPEFQSCRECADPESDSAPGFFDWSHTPDDEGVIWGECNKCGALQAICPDCGDNTGFCEGDFDAGIECSGGCGRIFIVTRPDHDDGRSEDSVSSQECSLLKLVVSRKNPMTLERATSMLNRTKWKYAIRGPQTLLDRMVSKGLITLRAGCITATDHGKELVDGHLQEIRSSLYGW